MLRRLGCIILLIFCGLFTLPFLISSLYIDQYGIGISGKIISKREIVKREYSSVRQLQQINVQYTKPDGSGVNFLNVPLSADEYDALSLEQVIRLHYLPSHAIPDLPFSRFLQEAQLLPRVRLANKTAFSNLQLSIGKHFIHPLLIVCAAIVLLVLWRIIRLPGFGWILGAAIAAGIIASFISDFPKPTPEPTRGVKTAVGRIQTLERIDHLFEGSNEEGVLANQPIQVVAVQFTPEGRTEPVVAVDLIDAGSVSGLHEGGSVSLNYESLSPRTAYIQGASRNFPSRNLAGLETTAMACVVVLIIFAVIVRALHKGLRSVLARR